MRSCRTDCARVEDGGCQPVPMSAVANTARGDTVLPARDVLLVVA